MTNIEKLSTDLRWFLSRSVSKQWRHVALHAVLEGEELFSAAQAQPGGFGEDNSGGAMLDELTWSRWLTLDRVTVHDSVPQMPGVYEVRPVGASSAAYIGSAAGEGGLRQRIGQRVSDPLRYLSVFEKQLVQIGLTLEFRCATADIPELAKAWESRLLSEYKLSHGGKLPPGNKLTPRKYSG